MFSDLNIDQQKTETHTHTQNSDKRSDASKFLTNNLRSPYTYSYKAWSHLLDFRPRPFPQPSPSNIPAFMEPLLHIPQYNDFKHSLSLFRQLKEKRAFPPKLQLKLEFLANIIQGLPVNTSAFAELDEEEKNALRVVEPANQVTLFLSIVKCLTGQFCENIECFIRKNRMFSSFEECFLSFDSEHFVVTRKQKDMFPMSKAKLSERVQKKSDKYVFKIQLENPPKSKSARITLVLGFSKKDQAEEILQKLRNAIREARVHSNNNLSGKPSVEADTRASNLININSSLRNTTGKIQPGLSRQEYLEDSIILPDDTAREAEENFDRQYESTESQSTKNINSNRNIKVSTGTSGNKSVTTTDDEPRVFEQPEEFEDPFQYLEQIESEASYNIVASVTGGRILQHNQDSSKLKLVLLLQCSLKPETIFEMITNVGFWNTNIAASKIISLIESNKYVMYEKHKAYSYQYRPRDFVFVRQGFQRTIRNNIDSSSSNKKINQKYYLVDQSIDHRETPPVTLVVRGSIVKRVIALIPQRNTNSQSDKQEYLLIIDSHILFGGYNSKENQKMLGVQYLKTFESLLTYCHQAQFSEAKRPILYDFSNIKASPMRKKKQTVESKPIQIQNKLVETKNVKDQKASQNNQPPATKLTIRSLEQELYKVMPRFASDPIQSEFISLVIDQQAHTGLCLKPRQINLTPTYVCTKPPNDFVFQNGEWMIKEKDFIFLNRAVMDAQKDVIKFIIRKIGSNIMSGKSIMNMSLPVDIFEGRSLLERSAQSFGYIPVFIKKAAQTTDIIEQMKLITTFSLGISTLELKSQKPFNPVIGETFQGFLGDVPICYEQISHHPPISSYYCKSHGFTVYGNLIAYAQLGINSGTGGNLGVMHFEFDSTGQHFELTFPVCEISGLVLGDRKFRMLDKFFVYNRKQKLFAEIAFGKEKKDIYPWPQREANTKYVASDLNGGIFKVTEEFMNKFLALKSKVGFGGLSKKDVVSRLASIEGAWNESVIWDGKVYKTLFQPEPYLLQYKQAPLASDSNFREDVIYKKIGNLATAQRAKEKIENMQRQDKKLRKENQKS